MSILDFPSNAQKPFYGSAPQKSFRTLSADFGDGYSQRLGDGLNTTIETWNLKWSVLTTAEKDVIVNFLDEREGYKAFNYTMPTESTSKKWICKSYKAEPLQPGLFSITASFERVYDL